MLQQIQEQLLSEITGKGDETLKNTPISFSMKVERFAHEGGLTLLDSLSVLVEESQLDPDQVPKLITPGLKQKLAIEVGIEKPGEPIDFG
jgi:hypothetical protein